METPCTKSLILICNFTRFSSSDLEIKNTVTIETKDRPLTLAKKFGQVIKIIFQESRVDKFLFSLFVCIN